MDDLQIKADSLSSHSSRSEGYTISAIVPSVGYFFSRKSMKNGEPTADTRFFNLKAAKTGPLGGRALAAVGLAAHEIFGCTFCLEVRKQVPRMGTVEAAVSCKDILQKVHPQTADSQCVLSEPTGNRGTQTVRPTRSDDRVNSMQIQ